MTYQSPETAAVRARQAELGEDWPTAFERLAEALNPVDTSPDPRERIESDAFNEGWTCPPPCRNTIDTSGFYPCDAAGAEVEPTAAEWDGKSLVCAECGRIMDATTNRNEGNGRWTVAVIGRKATASAVT